MRIDVLELIAEETALTGSRILAALDQYSDRRGWLPDYRIVFLSPMRTAEEREAWLASRPPCPCGKRPLPYSGRGRPAVFCSRRCKKRAADKKYLDRHRDTILAGQRRRKAARRQLVIAGRSCASCGGVIPEARNTLALYCSSRCGNAARRERRRHA